MDKVMGQSPEFGKDDDSYAYSATPCVKPNNLVELYIRIYAQAERFK
jgi:hypothetical protein